MGGGTKRRSKTTNYKQDKAEKPLESETSELEDDAAEKMEAQDHNETLRQGLATVSKDIKDIK